MQKTFMDSEMLRWGVGLILGFPALMLIVGEVIFHLDRRKHPLTSTLRIVRGLLLPATAVFLTLQHVIPVGRDDLWLRLVETVILLVLIHASLSLLNVVIFAHATEGSWQSRLPRLLVDVIRLILVLVGLSVVLSIVWGYDLGSLATALGVGSLVLGLALQDAVGNVFAGLLLMFERPITVGDWITVEGYSGKIVEINWRAVHLETFERVLVIVPNSVLAKGAISNYGRPTRLHGELLPFRFSVFDKPNEVRNLLADTIEGVRGILADPPADIITDSFGDGVVLYKVRFYVEDYADVERARSEYLTRVWYAARRLRLTLDHPTLYHLPADREAPPFRDKVPTPAAVAALFPQFGLSAVAEDGPEWRDVCLRHYSPGETVLRPGEAIPGLFLIFSGHVELAVRNEDGLLNITAGAGRGEYFGEKALLPGQSSDFFVVVAEELEVLVLPSTTLEAMLERSPRLASEIGRVMESRRAAALRASKRPVNAADQAFVHPRREDAARSVGASDRA
ncbi:mechanosensitive ion channel family protein [Paludisphaera mucosa]|uniref:Mechanosensitive ion channel family protein n=1 Tax=Paludisphaera mucosa TaxID=3030827 RepID=A0ABT6F4V6_9BACT|nr:mechanosensitive ion channel family protein [Paludisphaera mucosa]MDG3002618.1 mechanosensitive ion channel family protein [Paludisphaera mucosa]